MVTMTTKSTLNSIGLILILVIDNAAAGQHSGILSNLYKKAAQENRPLVLVLDNSQNGDALSGKSRDLDHSFSSKSKDLENYLNGKTRDLDYSPKYLDYSAKKTHELASKKWSALDSYTDKDTSLNSLPYLLLQHLAQQNSQNRDQPSKYKAHDHSLTKSKLPSKQRDRQRLLSRLDRGKDDDRDRRDRDRRDRVKNNRDRRDPLRQLVEKHIKDHREPHEQADDEKHERALRSSVIKNLLRISNDLNCEAKDECQDKCEDKYSNKKKKDACEDKCEDKFECEEDKQEEDNCAEKGDCDVEDDCPIDNDDCAVENDNPSTKGIPIEDEKKKDCKRC